MTLTTVRLDHPYLLFMGDVGDDGHAKTGHGIADWAPDKCAGQMRLAGCGVDMGLPEMSVADALSAGVRTAIIGVAPTGGQLPDAWLASLRDLARGGIDIASGLHTRLSAIPELIEAAAAGSARLIDVRVPPAGIPVGSGRKRSGRRVLTVGTDCAVGKKYTALSLHRELVRRGMNATFRATGQTGIMIAGEGMPIDAVVADFIAGAAEVLSPDNADDHIDVIEGQGSLMHPSYAGVTLGLIHGSQPDAIVLCHDADRKEILGYEGNFPMPEIADVIRQALWAARVTNAACVCVGISVNTSKLETCARKDYLRALGDDHGMPCVDPIATGIAPIADRLMEALG